MRVFLTAVVVALVSLAGIAAGVVVTGTVVDPAGSAIPGAKVELISRGAVVGSSVSGADGSFRFADVAAGSYEVRVTLAGFRQARVTMTVGTTAPPPLRVKLLVGSTAESVEVNLAAPAADAARVAGGVPGGVVGGVVGGLPAAVAAAPDMAVEREPALDE